MSDESELGNQSEMESFNESDSPDEADPDVVIIHDIVHLRASTTGDYSQSEIGKLPEQNTFFLPGRVKRNISSNDSDVIIDEDEIPDGAIRITSDTHFIGSSRGTSELGDFEMDEQEFLNITIEENGNEQELEEHLRNAYRHEEEECFEEEDDIIELPPLPVKPAVKKPRRKLPKHLSIESGSTAKTSKLVAEVVHDHPRPVNYRMKPAVTDDGKVVEQKRTRVTRNIMSHTIPQYHLEGEETEFGRVKESTLSKTIEQYLQAGKLVSPKCDQFREQIVATAVEYDGSVKMLQFENALKKHSGKQKRLKYQTGWWKASKSHYERAVNGYVAMPKTPVLSISDDPVLYKHHSLFPKNQSSELEKINVQLRIRLNSKRQNNDVIPDSSYFVREFLMQKHSISLRMNRSSDLPELFVPPTLECGYFPQDAVTVQQQEHYLMMRFEEAQDEYHNITYRSIAPPVEFQVGTISAKELHKFHRIGRHIHGFFVVWENKFPEYDESGICCPRKRYLVDMFNLICFPLYTEYEQWESRLRVAFDKTIVYNLHLSEILRCNRPVFDFLSKNKSMLQPITLKEIVYLIEQSNMDAKSFAVKFGLRTFYDHGRATSNKDYLSAFLIITGGAKVVTEEIDSERLRVFNSDYMESGVLTSSGDVYTFEFDKIPNNYQISIGCNADGVAEMEQEDVRHELSECSSRITRIIGDSKKPEKIIARPLVKTNQNDGMKFFTRKDLLNYRIKLYDPSYVVPRAKKQIVNEPAKKKPGRKSKTRYDAAMQQNNFEIEGVPSDVDSEFEGYLSDSENVFQKPSKLMRSTSSDSVFIDYQYREKMFLDVSWFHQQKMIDRSLPPLKKRKRKMNRIYHKHSVRYTMLQANGCAFTEMYRCYDKILPCGTKEIARTKNAIRFPHRFRTYNIPQVYGPGDKQLITEVFGVVKDVITRATGFESASIRTANDIAQAVYDANIARRELLENLEPSDNGILPSPAYLAIEMLSHQKMSGRLCLESARKDVQNNVDKMYNDYMDLDPLDKELHFEISQSIRQSKLNESLEEYERNRERQLAKTLKTVPMDKRSQAALARREEKRRESRRKLADKYAEQRRMMASTRRLEKRTTQKQVDPETIQRLRREDEVRKRKRFEEEDRRGMIRRREERVALQEKVDRMLEEGLRLEKVREAERIRQQQEEERIEMETILISRRVREEEEEKMRLERLRKAEREREQERLKREEEEERKRLEQLREAEKLKAEIEKENERKLQEERTRKALELERKIEEIKRVSTLKDMFGPLPIAKENEQTEKDFQILLDDHELTLLTISRDPLNEKYQEARTEFERLDIKSMLLRKAEKLIDVLTIHYDVPIEQTCRYFTSSIESNENRMAVNEQLNKLFENMANCFTFNIQDGENGLQSKRKWDFQFKKCAVFDGVSQSTVNFIEEKMRENTKKKHLATPKTVISIDTSLLKQSLLRSHARFDPDISLYAQNHTANSIGDVTLKMSNYSLDFATQSIHDKELAEKATPKKGPTVRRHIKNLFGSEKVIVRRSLAAGKPASLNSEDSDSEDSREGSPVAEFLPTNPVCSFWKLVVKIENSTTDKEKTELCEDLDKLILRKDDLFSKSLKWMFPLLATFYVLLSNAVLNENEEIISDKNQTGVTKDEILKSTINDLMIIAAYFEEGSRERSNLRKMISMNGFSVVFNRVILFAKKTCTLAKELESNSRSLSGYVIEDLFESLLAEIERTMRQELGSSVRKTGKLERDFEEIVKLIQNEKKLALSHKSHKNDENRRFRLNTVVKWYDAIICHCKEELTQAIVDAFPLNAITKNKETSHVAMENGDDEAMLSDTSDNQMSTTDYQMPKNICRNSEIFPEDAFAKAYAVVRIPSKKERAQMLSVYRKKNAQSGCVENKGLSRMPKFEEPFVDSVWRTIEKRINNMTHSEEKQIKRFIPVSRSHKLNEKVKFYAMVMIQERDSRDTRLFNSKFQDDNLWHCYSKSSLNHEKMESRILQHIEHTVLSKSNFNQMKWSVQCVNGNKKDAIHYFTDLYKYRSESEFRSALSCGKLKFNFKVYTHLWFMGNLLPTSYNPDSHDDKLFVPCSGCTSGDVIIIHKCTCAYHNDTFSDKFIYANTSLPVGIDKVTRLVGRFVCEHGPSSFLILEHCSANVDANIPFESENVEFSAELRIVKRKTMHSQLVKTFAEEHTHLRDASRHRAISTVALDSSGSGRSTRCEIFEDSPSEDENDENQLDTTRIGRKIDPIIVDSDKAYLIAEGERMALRIKRLLDPELQKFRSKNFVSRSKSVDAPKTSKQKTVIRRSQSVCDLNDVNEYAQKKVRNTKDSFATLFRDHEYSTRRTYEEQLNNELLDVVTTFGGASNVSADKKYNILASILAFEKEVQLVNDKNGELFKTVSNLVQRNSLQHVKGVILAEDNQTLRSTDNTSEVFPESKAVNEYLKFEIYKRKMMVNAKLMADTVKDLKLKHAEYRPFAKLIATYDSIFKFNVYLFEHFLNCISKHVFNPYAIYCEETRPTGTELSKFQLTLKLIETSMPTVLSMLFNTEPLRRQLSELSEIHKKVRSEDLACTIASLCRYAIERIRIPQTADKRLCDFSWLNSAEDHRETVSFIRLTLEHTLPDMKTENEQTRFVEFLKEAEGFHFSYKFVEAQCKTFVRNHGDSKQAFFTAFYNQNEAFYGSLQKFMSNGTIDPKMKLYYQHQAFLRLHNIVKKRSHIITSDDYHRSSDVCKAMLLSEIVSNPKIAQEAYISGSVLDRMYTSLCKIKAKMPLISPSYIGTSLTCFEDELLFSAVREAKVHTDTRVVFRSKSCMRPNEKAGDANFKTCKVTLLVNLETALLSMVFKSRDQSEIDKDDRLDIDILDEEVIKPIIDWNRIFETFIQPTYNTLFSRMEKRERVSILPENPLGRLENYAFTNPNQDKDCQAVLEYIDVASDTDAEESIEDPLDIVEMTLKRALPRSMSPSSKRRRMR